MADSSSDSDMPLAGIAARHAASAPPAQQEPAQPDAAAAAAKPSSSEDSDIPLSKRRKAVATPPANSKPRSKPKAPVIDDPSSSSSESDADSDDSGVPLSQRKKPAKRPAKRSSSTPAAKRQRTTRGSSGGPGNKSSNGDKKWDTLEHHGVLFPEEYKPHGVKMLYDGRHVDLTPEEEEVASMYAIMLETDFMQKPTFHKNFWEGFKQVLRKDHPIKCLEKCDFRPIYDHLMAERDRKKNMSKEEKAAIKAEKDKVEEKHKFALVDGRKEQVGNFRVEPPGLFRGRGEHPRMGKIKKRVYPRDITINIGRNAKIPEHPFPGQEWKEIRHDNTVTWLAYWKDTINPKEYKYVWLAANSTFKADSDQAKYEKARKLKEYIEDIRANYTRDWSSKDVRRQQMAVAVYFLDRLALRAGHEKDEDEADTVGCCTLKVENVELQPPNHIKFDFLGKDSIRYENLVDVDTRVYKAVELFKKRDQYGKVKQDRDMLFDTFDATDLNKELKQLMDGLSVKVFRTYNASITLDRLLHEAENSSHAVTVDQKKAEYDRANKEVAILCNHQKSVAKTHEQAMGRLQEKLDKMREELAELEADLELARKGKTSTKDGRKIGSVEQMQSKVERKRAQLDKADLTAKVKEDLKTIALGTSKINYMDPRITIAWCKRNEVPMERVFNKSLLSKFFWAMDVNMDFRF